jgi:hypothetical protein
MRSRRHIILIPFTRPAWRSPLDFRDLTIPHDPYVYTGCNWKLRAGFGHEVYIPEQEKNHPYQHVSGNIYLWAVAERILYRHHQQFSVNVIVDDCLVGPHVLPHGLQAPPPPRVPLTWSAKATGIHSTNLVHAWWRSVLYEMFSVTRVMTEG